MEGPFMKIACSVTELIGRTPLLELRNYEKDHGLQSTLLAKLECKNPAGSAKDRVAANMIARAEAEGKLAPGATIIEPTSGNTGIGLAAVGAALGYHVILTMPDTMSVERRSLIAAYGAEIVLTPGSEGMAGAVGKAEALHRETPGSIIAGQFDNPLAAKIAGVSKIFKAGGVQAIGAMAYGTESVPKVYKIFGPGNQFVMAAKQQVSLHDVAIDMPAGPSEVCLIADETANSVFAAADLLSQAEHGFDSQVFFITTSEKVLEDVKKEVEVQLEQLPRKEMAQTSLDNSKFILVKDEEEAIDLCNTYAPEHLIIATADYEQLAEKVVNAGSVFLGNYACESAGDYASGTNHTLPTHGYALAYNGVNLDSYNRKITFQHLTEEGIRNIGDAVVTMAENEQLEAHANAMRLRVKSLK